MASTLEYYKRVKQVQGELENSHPGRPVYLTFTDTRFAGSVVAAEPSVAAECIVTGTHRLSTQEEIAKFQADQLAARDRLEKLRRSRREMFVINVSPDDVRSGTGRKPTPA